MAVANSNRGDVYVTIAGTRYRLHFGMNELAELEEATGMAVASLFVKEHIRERVGVKVVRDALAIGMRGARKAVTNEQVGQLMDKDPNGLGGWMLAIAQGVTYALRGPDATLPTEEEQEAEEAGATSTPDPTSAEPTAG